MNIEEKFACKASFLSYHTRISIQYIFWFSFNILQWQVLVSDTFLMWEGRVGDESWIIVFRFQEEICSCCHRISCLLLSSVAVLCFSAFTTCEARIQRKQNPSRLLQINKQFLTPLFHAWINSLISLVIFHQSSRFLVLKT